MNAIARLRRAIESPRLFLRHLNRLYHRRALQRPYNTEGVDVPGEDWDNMLLLDACRYDMFDEHHTLPGRLEHRISRESATTEFLLANFHQKTLHDTVYVTANPQLYRNRTRIDVEFHDVINIWMEEGWDSDEQTVLPETVTEYAEQAAADYPNKRLMVHYIQPHYPFVGADTTFDKGHLEGNGGENIWGQLMTGSIDVDKDTIWELYTDNLERALPAVESLMDTITGKTVVTADHGNMIGERSTPLPITEWGHPRGIYTEQLVKVPWLVYENGSRRKIVKEPPRAEDDAVDETVVSERLRNLGYAE